MSGRLFEVHGVPAIRVPRTTVVQTARMDGEPRSIVMDVETIDLREYAVTLEVDTRDRGSGDGVLGRLHESRWTLINDLLQHGDVWHDPECQYADHLVWRVDDNGETYLALQVSVVFRVGSRASVDESETQ